MIDPILRDAIDEIVRGAFVQNWLFYGLVAAITLISTVLGNAIASYARKRGDTLATKADFDEIIRQLRTSTKTVEDIKTSVQHSDWLSREWKVVRRTKLEELLDSVYSAEYWLEACRNRWVFQKTVDLGPDPTDKVKRLSALYFPELGMQVSDLRVAQCEATSFCLTLGRNLNFAGQDFKARQKLIDAAVLDWNSHYQAVSRAISNLETKATEMMDAIKDA